MSGLYFSKDNCSLLREMNTCSILGPYSLSDLIRTGNSAVVEVSLRPLT